MRCVSAFVPTFSKKNLDLRLDSLTWFNIKYFFFEKSETDKWTENFKTDYKGMGTPVDLRKYVTNDCELNWN